MLTELQNLFRFLSRIAGKFLKPKGNLSENLFEMKFSVSKNCFYVRQKTVILLGKSGRQRMSVASPGIATSLSKITFLPSCPTEFSGIENFVIN